MTIAKGGITVVAADGTSDAAILSALAAIIGDLTAHGMPTAETTAVVVAKKADGPGMVDNDRAARTLAAPVVYKMRPKFDAKVADGQTASNAAVLKVIRSHRSGVSARTIADKTGINPKTVQSCVYQLRHAHLIDSERA